MLYPVVRAAMDGCPEHVTGSTVRLTTPQLQLIATLRQPPVAAAAQPVWYQCKGAGTGGDFSGQKPEGNFFLHAAAAPRAGTSNR